MMRRAAIALFLIPSLALADAPRLEPRLESLTVPQLFAEYEVIDNSRPGLGGPIAISAISLGLIVLGFTVGSGASRLPLGGLRDGLGVTSIAMMATGVVALLGAFAWLVLNVRRRAQLGEQLDAVQAELDARERKDAQAASPELLALLAAPVETAATGGLVVVVSDARGPVPQATVAAAGRSYTCDARGTVAIEGLAPGPVALAVSAPGHVAADEAASVVAGKRTQVSLTLLADKERATARLAGYVKSSSTGAPLPAQLEIVETKAKVAVDGQGTFKVDVPGGSYTVVISAPGYLKQTKVVKVEPSDRAIFNVVLHPAL